MNKFKVKISKRYSRALFELAREQGQLEKVAETLADIAQLICDSKDFAEFLAAPRAAEKQQRAVIEALFTSKVDKLTHHFLLLLSKKNKILFLPEICKNFAQLHLNQKSILKAKLISYQKLTDEQVRKICIKLRRQFEKEISPEQKLDLDLLGGFRIHLGDKIYDSSIQSQLERFRQAVMAA